jgi:alkylation response protein AidB-like acyl-CoA dehydrogenase
VRASDPWYQLHPSLAGGEALRREVREFVDVEISAGSFTPRCNAWIDGHDPSFSRKLGQRGWLGLTWPERYGGGGRSALDRYVVLEELLAAGAPVAAHWIAERQIGPSLVRFGTEAQRQLMLPSIAAGECYVAIGMSEPGSGSDLASVSTRAHRVDGGWRINGRKIWTSHAHRSHYLVALCRSSDPTDSRHQGLSQFIIDLASTGVETRPIQLMNGESHFAEVALDSVFVPEGMLLGQEGQGWEQVNAELAFERSGPERFLSTFPLLMALGETLERAGDRSYDDDFGDCIAELWSLRAMSLSVAAQLDAGTAPHVEAAIVKYLGAQFENLIVDLSARLAPRPLTRTSKSSFDALLAQSILAAPGFTLRGGTTEILRGIIAKALPS